MILNSNSKTITDDLSFHRNRNVNHTSQQLRNIDRRWNSLEQVSQKQKESQKQVIQTNLNDLNNASRQACEDISNKMENTKLQIIQLQSEIQQYNEHSNYFSNQDESRQSNINHFLENKKSEQTVNYKSQKQDCQNIIDKKFKQTNQIIEERQNALNRQNRIKIDNLRKLIQQSKSELSSEEVQRKKNQQKLLDQIENEVDQFVVAIQVEQKIKNETEQKINSMVDHYSQILKQKINQEKEDREFSTANILEMLEKITQQVQSQL